MVPTQMQGDALSNNKATLGGDTDPHARVSIVQIKLQLIVLFN